MPGPRKDKEYAWTKVERLLALQRQVTDALLKVNREMPQKCWREEADMVVADLKTRGRLSANQIVLIAKLIRAVMRIQANADPARTDL